MPEPTPGAVAYAAFWATDLPDFRGPAWTDLTPCTQARWEAAAQAVLEHATVRAVAEAAVQAVLAAQEEMPDA